MAESNYSGNLTAERLRELTEYFPETGLFRWSVSSARRIKVGDVAGCLNGSGYRVIKVDGKNCPAHRLAWLYVHGQWPKADIDHIDRNRSNNRISNLREATRTENNQNTSKRRDNTSGHVGVTWDKVRQRWRVQIRHLGRNIYLGLFIDIKDAVAARKAGELKYWGAIRAE